MGIIKGILYLAIMFSVLIGGMFLLPKENWNTEERFIKRCDTGETFYMTSWDAQRCTARLLAKQKEPVTE